MEIIANDKPSPSPEELLQVNSLEDLYLGLGRISMMAGWNRPKPTMWWSPVTTFCLHIGVILKRKLPWSAGRLVDADRAERRNLNLVNPMEGNTHANARRAMLSAYQMLGPGEHARSHRHMPNWRD